MTAASAVYDAAINIAIDWLMLEFTAWELRTNFPYVPRWFLHFQYGLWWGWMVYDTWAILAAYMSYING